MRFFLRASSCNDVMEACRLSWLEAQKKFTRAEKRDRDFTKRAFKLTFIGVASAVLMNADPGDDEVTIFSRDEETPYLSLYPSVLSLIPSFVSIVSPSMRFPRSPVRALFRKCSRFSRPSGLRLLPPSSRPPSPSSAPTSLLCLSMCGISRST